MIRDLLKNSETLIQLLIAIIVISLGINLLAGFISKQFELNQNMILWGGLSLVLIPICYLLFTFLKKRNVSIKYDSLILFNKEKNELVPIPGFRFATDMKKYMNGVFLENLALKKMWDDEKLYNGSSTSLKDLLNAKPKKLIYELIEFYFLRELSFHLDDFFNNQDLNDDNIETFKRSDLPQFLLENRVFELFTKPYEERIKIIEDMSEKKVSPLYRVKDGSDEKEIVSIITPDGGIYDLFELKLPKKSKIHRTKNDSIEINTPGYKIEFGIDFEGYATSLPTYFSMLYLDFTKNETNNHLPLMLDLYLNIKYKFTFTLKPFSLSYHNWLDSFIERFDEKVDFKTFIKRINWDSNSTILKILLLKEVNENDDKDTKEDKEN